MTTVLQSSPLHGPGSRIRIQPLLICRADTDTPSRPIACRCSNRFTKHGKRLLSPIGETRIARRQYRPIIHSPAALACASAQVLRACHSIRCRTGKIFMRLGHPGMRCALLRSSVCRRHNESQTFYNFIVLHCPRHRNSAGLTVCVPQQSRSSP